MDYQIQNTEYLQLFGVDGANVSAREFWRQLSSRSPLSEVIGVILAHGNLSERIKASLPSDFTPSQVQATYAKLAGCLETNTLFLPLV